MPYLPEWELLSEAFQRVVDSGMSETAAKIDICRAVADRKVASRVRVDGSERRIGNRLLEGDNVGVPVRLEPSDFDWAESKPARKWSIGPAGPQYYSAPDWSWKPCMISLVELCVRDTIEILCTARDEELSITATAPKPSAVQPHSGEIEFRGSDEFENERSSGRQSTSQNRSPFKQWHRLRVKALAAEGKPPTEQDDVKAARTAGYPMSRDQIRCARREMQKEYPALGTPGPRGGRRSAG